MSHSKMRDVISSLPVDERTGAMCDFIRLVCTGLKLGLRINQIAEMAGCPEQLVMSIRYFSGLQDVHLEKIAKLKEYMKLLSSPASINPINATASDDARNNKD